MNRTLVEKTPFRLPEEIERFTPGAHIYDSSCSPEARVYFIDRDSGYYLKKGKSGTLAREAALSDYFHKKWLAARASFILNTGRKRLASHSARRGRRLHARKLSFRAEKACRHHWGHSASAARDRFLGLPRDGPHKSIS